MHDHEIRTDKVLRMLCLHQPIALADVVSLHVIDDAVSLGVVLVEHFFSPDVHDAHLGVHNHEIIVGVEEDFRVLRAINPCDFLVPLQIELE